MTTQNTSSAVDRLVLGITLLLIFILLTRTPADADMWWHLRAGDEMVQRGQILLRDVFSYTRAGTPWINAFWLADIFLFLIYKLGGYFTLAGFVALMAVATLGIVNIQTKGSAFLRALVLLLAALTFAPIWTPRPQLFSFLLLAFLDGWLYRLKKGRSVRLWILVPLFALWANLHGGYVWGILLLVAEITGMLFDRWFSVDASRENASDIVHKLLGFTLLGSLAVLLNPNGFALWELPFKTVDISLNVIQEWLSPDFHQLNFQPLLWMFLLLITTLGLSQKRVRFGNLFKVLGFGYLTFISQRNMAPFAIIAAPMIARHLAEVLDGLRGTPVGRLAQRFARDSEHVQLPLKLVRGINVVLVSLISVAALGNLYLVTRPAEVDAYYPLDAVRWIAENQPPGALFNSYNWGGYLTWNLRDYPVYIDGRADLYGDALIGEWWQVVRGGETAYQILDARQINLILLEPDYPLLKELPSRGWKLLYRDGMAVIYGR
ncbi:MAG: hypothetical protein L3J16_06245 [Anaerolineales bacterium]|nr:hypothetical protein [Anaerolineales bacterium]